MSELNTRPAKLYEAATLTEIAHAAKRHWGYPEEWIVLWHDSLTVTADDISELEIYVATLDDRIIGFYALAESEDCWDLDHFWIRPQFIGLGFGRILFQHAVQLLQTLAPGAVLEIESDPNAESFYLHMGAKRVGEITRQWRGLKRTLPCLRHSP